MMRKFWKYLSLIVIAGLLAAVFLYGCGYWYDHRAGNFAEEVELYIYPGMSAEAVCDSLTATGKVRRPRTLIRAFRREKAEQMRPGHYLLKPSSTNVYAARMAKLGWQTPVDLALSGAIRSRGALARKIAAQMLADSAALAAAFCDTLLLSKYGVDTTSFFSLIIPDTYQMYWTATPEEMLDRFKEEHDAFWTAERLRQAEEQRLSPLEVSTLASIVDGETRYVPEMPKIAGVYLNRLRIGMKLQADPTIAYCYGYQLNRILRKHLLVDSPYNTYQHAGLPPGPISCPPRHCLEAVLNPDLHGYLYFCASPDFNGSHLFAASYPEHLKNARAFQRALTRRQRERAAARQATAG